MTYYWPKIVFPQTDLLSLYVNTNVHNSRQLRDYCPTTLYLYSLLIGLNSWSGSGSIHIYVRPKPKNMHAKSQHSSSCSFRDLSVHTDGRTWQVYMGSETLPSTCSILSDEYSTPFYSTSDWYNKFVNWIYHAQPNTPKPPKTVALTFLYS